MQPVRALIVIAGLLVVAGVAAAATPQPTTLIKSSSPVEAVSQDGGLLGWISGSQKKCNTVHISDGKKTTVIPQPPNGTMTCRWALTPGAEQLALAEGASAALWTLHEHYTDFVMTAPIAGKEVKVEQLAHASDGTGWWLGGIAGGGATLAYSTANVEYVDPLGCGSGQSCAKKIAGGGVELVSNGQKTALPNSLPALGLAVSNGRIAYIQATGVTKRGAPLSSSTVAVQVVDISNGAVVSQASPVGVPIAVGLAPHVLAVLSRDGAKTLLTWYDPGSAAELGGMTVPAKTAAELAVDDQIIVYRVNRFLHALTVATTRDHVIAKTAARPFDLSLAQARLAWVETSRTSGRIRGLSAP